MARETRTTVRCDMPGCDAFIGWLVAEPPQEYVQTVTVTAEEHVSRTVVTFQVELCPGHRTGLTNMLAQLLEQYGWKKP